MSNALLMFNTDGNIAMDSTNMSDTGLFFPTSLRNRQDIINAAQITCLDSNDYWTLNDTIDNNAHRVNYSTINVGTDHSDKFLNLKF